MTSDSQAVYRRYHCRGQSGLDLRHSFACQMWWRHKTPPTCI